MNEPISPTPAANDASFDSLTADLVVADDRGGGTVMPADPQALASYLADCRRLERNSADKREARKSE